MPKKYIVKLTADERTELEELFTGGRESVRKLTRARILLKADEGWTDEAIHAALDVSIATIERVRQRCVEEGAMAALTRRKSHRTYERLLDGQAEAHLVALACQKPQLGRRRWTLRLLADKLVALESIEVDTISHETVRQVLVSNAIKPWLYKEWVIPPQANAAFVCQMELILDIYHEPYDPLYPVICFDESSKQLLKEKRLPLATAPGQVQRYDYEYERNGTRNLFMFTEPLRGWRYVKVTARRAKQDWAECMRQLVDDFYPQARRVRVIQDNLNTHTLASLYTTFPPAEAKRICDRLELHFTPKHGSWLNIAEIEFSVLARQCLNQRIADEAQLRAEITAWMKTRNTLTKRVDWRFTTAQARTKLKRLYPSFHA